MNSLVLALSILADLIDSSALASYQWDELGYNDAWASSFVPPTPKELKTKAVNVIADYISDLALEIDAIKTERS